MRIIDADGHVQEKQIPWADLLEEPYRSRAPREVKDNRGFSFCHDRRAIDSEAGGQSMQLRRRAAQPQPAAHDGHDRSGPTSQGHGPRRNRSGSPYSAPLRF